MALPDCYDRPSRFGWRDVWVAIVIVFNLKARTQQFRYFLVSDQLLIGQGVRAAYMPSIYGFLDASLSLYHLFDWVRFAVLVLFDEQFYRYTGFSFFIDHSAVLQCR